jgi:dihydrolipoamide dehydrogenase
LKFILGSNVVGGKAGASGCEVVIEHKDETHLRETIKCDLIMVTAGRRPFTQGLNLDKVGLVTDK